MESPRVIELTSPLRPGRGRPALAPGEHGNIETSAWVVDNKTGRLRRKRTQGDSRRTTVHWTAETYIGTDDGKKRVQARGKSAVEATAALRAKLEPKRRDLLAEALAGKAPSNTLTNKSTLGEALDAWIADPAVRQKMSAGTLVRYSHAIERSIKGRTLELPGRSKSTLGAQRLDRITRNVLEVFIGSLSPAVGKTCRGILRQALTYASKHGADAAAKDQVNRVQVTIESDGERVKPTVAITKKQAEDIITRVSADERCAKTDVPALLRFLAGTGCRLGEVLALTWGQLEIDGPAPRVHVNATVNGLGQRQPFPKTKAGVRRLYLPPDVVEMLLERQKSATGDLVFPSTRRRNDARQETPYWASNITGLIREHLDRILVDEAKVNGLKTYECITARSFRRMVATELDKAGLSAREQADQLGHAKPSVTMDVYQAREGVGPAAAAAMLTLSSKEPGTAR